LFSSSRDLARALPAQIGDWRQTQGFAGDDLKGRTSHGGGPAASSIARRSVRPGIYASLMKKLQQELPFRQWGGARRGAGRKRTSARQNVPHRVRRQFRKGALHVTVRIRREVWNLRTHRCFRALRRAFERGCQRFGFRLVHFSVLGGWS